MRIAVLWTRPSGYLNSSLQALSQCADAMMVSYGQPLSGAPFDAAMFGWLDNAYRYTDAPDATELLRRISDFRPTLLLINSWDIPAYRAVAKAYRGIVPRIVCMDNQWLGTLKQYAGIVVSPWYIRPFYDGAFVASARSAQFAAYLGIPNTRIYHGLYSADSNMFDPLAEKRDYSNRTFLQVGRLVPVKGVEVLLDGYRIYRKTVPDPWGLTLCGTGPERWRCEGVAGVKLTGFLQPAEIRTELAKAGGLIMASRFEPWGVAIHEAACAGLPLICTTACGAASSLVQDGYNGFLIPPGDSEALAQAMKRITLLEVSQRQAYGAASFNLSRQFSSKRFADTVMRMGAELELLGQKRNNAA